MPKFRQVNGITIYALACGHVQCVTLDNDLSDRRIWLEQDSGCFHVRAHDYKKGERLMWDSFSLSELGKARRHWLDAVRMYAGSEIKSIKKDKRYTVTREAHGGANPGYVARFNDEWIKACDTPQAAWASAYNHNRTRIWDAEPR